MFILSDLKLPETRAPCVAFSLEQTIALCSLWIFELLCGANKTGVA